MVLWPEFWKPNNPDRSALCICGRQPVVAPQIQSLLDPMTNPLRVVVVGSGIGAQHVRGYRAASDLFEITAICDIDPERGAALAEECGIQLLTDFEAAIHRTDVDIVDLCTPPTLHFQQMCAAIEAGKHVICEKPIVGSLAELDQLEDLAQKTGKQIMPIFQYRFGRGLQKLKYLIERQLTGEAFVFNVDVAWWRSGDYYSIPWRGKRATELGGALLSQAIHAVDMVFYILGPARSLFARTATRVNPIEVEDCVAIAIEMGDGSLGTISVTLGSAAQISRHRFTFRNLSAESNAEPYTNSGEPWMFSFPEEKRGLQIEQALAEFTPSAEGYEGQFRRFHQSFIHGESPPVTLADARRVLEFIGAVYSSAESGERVSLPLTRTNPKYNRF
jgi:predicted dehydrogenase